jgi:hypothetical protein
MLKLTIKFKFTWSDYSRLSFEKIKQDKNMNYSKNNNKKSIKECET